MRRPILVALSTAISTLALAVSATAFAQSAPLKLEPIPEPPPAVGNLNDALEPQVTITKRGDDKVEEYRINGKLYMLKVIPTIGPSYFLLDNRGDGVWAKQDPRDSGVRVPMWVIGTF